MHVLIVEDDYLQAEWIQSEVLQQNFRGVTCERIPTEYDFRARLESSQSSPDLVLMDIMLRWTDPDSTIEAPEEIRRDGFHRAGLRCERLLRGCERTASVPVILYTVLDKIDLGEDLKNIHAMTRYVEKNSDSNELVQVIRELGGQG